MEKLAADREREEVSDDTPPGWWDAVLNDPRAAGAPWLPIEQRRLSEVPRHMLRVECMKCARTVEIQKADAFKLYGPHAVLKDIGMALLETGCKFRTGSREDGCWPSWISK